MNLPPCEFLRMLPRNESVCQCAISLTVTVTPHRAQYEPWELIPCASDYSWGYCWRAEGPFRRYHTD